jgi:hypothetical protein
MEAEREDVLMGTDNRLLKKLLVIAISVLMVEFLFAAAAKAEEPSGTVRTETEAECLVPAER